MTSTPTAALVDPTIASPIEQTLAIWVLEHDLLDPVAAVEILTSEPDTTAVLARLTEARPGQPPLVERPALFTAIARTLGHEYAHLGDPDVAIEVERVGDLGADSLARHVAVPVRIHGRDGLVVANPAAPAVRQLADRIAPGDCQIWLGDPAAILASLRRVQVRSTIDAAGAPQDTPEGVSRIVAPRIAIDESSNQGWVRETINKAIARRASDIHVSLSAAGTLRVAYRIDGTLQAQVVDGIAPDRAINTVVQTANLDVGVKNQPQSGRFDHTAPDGRRYNVRAELLPSVTGPDISLRLLAANALMTLDQMGFTDAYVERLRQVMRRHNGLILVTGPTGSGKTTTLYGALLEARDGRRKIIAIENPVEYRIDGVTQVQVEPRIQGSMGWLDAIASSLRSDPDIMLIGEIRDAATAQAAVQASQTGHLVLATLHTNNAVAAFSRLHALGVDPVEIAAQTVLVTGQRLVPKLHSCAVERTLTSEDRKLLTASGVTPPSTGFYPAGCDACDGLGTLDRVPLIEMLAPDRPVRAAVSAGASESELLEHLNDANFLGFDAEARRLIDNALAAPDQVASRLREEAVDIAAEAAAREVA